MKSLYEKMSGNDIEIGDVQVSAIISTDTNYGIDFLEQRYKKHLNNIIIINFKTIAYYIIKSLLLKKLNVAG